MADNVKANKMNSQADDDIGFGIYTDIADLPMTGCPSYIEEGIGGVCESGTATIVVFDVPFQIECGHYLDAVATRFYQRN